MDWRDAYLAQPRSDFEIFQRLRVAEDVPLCHKLHFLQMATEKLAKVFLTLAGAGPFDRTHDAFQRFMRMARDDGRIRLVCGFHRKNHFRAYIDRLRDNAKLIEDLSPEGDDHPNPEYPWLDISGTTFSPLEYGFPALDLQNAKMIKLVQSVQRCLGIAS